MLHGENVPGLVTEVILLVYKNALNLNYSSKASLCK